MSTKHTIDVAQYYMFDVYNQVDHADSLVDNARAALNNGDVAEALDSLRRALAPTESAPTYIRLAIEYLEQLQKEGQHEAGGGENG